MASVGAGCASEVAASVRTEGDAVKKKLPFCGKEKWGAAGVSPSELPNGCSNRPAEAWLESESPKRIGGLTEAVFPFPQRGEYSDRIVAIHSTGGLQGMQY